MFIGLQDSWVSVDTGFSGADTVMITVYLGMLSSLLYIFFGDDTDISIYTYSSTLTFSTQVRSLQVVCLTLKRLGLNRVLLTWHVGTSSPVGWRWNVWNTSLAEPSRESPQNAFPSTRGSVQIRSVFMVPIYFCNPAIL